MNTLPPLAYFEGTQAALGHRFELERLVAANRERVLFTAVDRVLRRRISLRVNFFFSQELRTWFMREAEGLAQLDHPAIRHVYDAGVVGNLAYRVGNWIDGENLAEAMLRGSRPLPAVMGLARDLLSGLEHIHANGIIVRRVVPASLLVNLSGRGTITDLRFSSFVLPVIPQGETPSGLHYMAPETRDGGVGDPASDIYTVGALLYYAITGQEPPLDSASIKSPSALRPNTPGAIERILMRSLQIDPDERYLSAQEMLEDLASEAGTFDSPVNMVGQRITATTDEGRHWEKRLRRALGDDYELLGTLGSGGYGRVYRVRDLHLEREVALKVLHPRLTADPAVLERFRREAQLAARLNHPNIVNIYDIGGRAGLIWYTMEHVRGRNLAQIVETDGPFTLEAAIRLLREALSALGHAHAAGLVHRDIKPENMLIDGEGKLRITDFGLALALRGQGKFGGATSQSGTPQFASPEQLLGERVDQRSDLYSLSAVAYFAFLGEPPFGGNTPEAVLARQTTNRFPPLAEQRADLPIELPRALERALQAEVELRYPSAIEMLQAVNRAVGIRRRSGEWARQAMRWWRP
ncbi:MAG TPA: serine/threonine-protein kinase [Gemmatimonadales bacterium]|nr:serine/threonine-protein kinase [Gemmatimonadales bacterium]